MSVCLLRQIINVYKYHCTHKRYIANNKLCARWKAFFNVTKLMTLEMNRNDIWHTSRTIK